MDKTNKSSKPAWAADSDDPKVSKIDAQVEQSVLNITKQCKQTIELPAEPGKLFGDSLDRNTRLDKHWAGWRAVSMTSDQRYARNTTYFSYMCDNNNYEDLEHALADAAEVLDSCVVFNLAGADGDDLNNAFICHYGIDEKEFKEEHPDKLYTLLKRAWRMGDAANRQQVKKAFNKLAKDGNLDAQKTILTQAGDLTPGEGPGGDLYILVDNEDKNA